MRQKLWLKWGQLAGLAWLITLGLSWSVAAQEPDDPLMLGAWLYEGHCVRCHGAYERQRVGQGASAEEVEQDIADGDCAVSWSRRAGGPLSNTQIKAVTQYILAWEERGGPPDLPDLPPQPTPTPSPPPLPATGETSPTPTPTPTPPLIDETVQLIISGNPVAWGAWLYTQHCYRCHQAYEDTRQGRGASVELLKETIENGKIATNMKPFSQKKGGVLKNSEIEAIILYIRTWEELQTNPALPATLLTPPTPDPQASQPVALPDIPVLQGDAGNGAALFAQYCRKCHGSTGQGRFGPALTRGWPSSRPDLTIYSTIDRGVPGSLMPAWGQVNGGPLPEQSLKDLTAFILKQNVAQPPAGQIAASGSPSLWQGPLGLIALLSGPGFAVFAAFRAKPYIRRRPKKLQNSPGTD